MLLGIIIVLILPLKTRAMDDTQLFIVGSTSMAQVLEVVKHQFHQDKGIKILVRPIGSDKGVVSIAEGLSDIGIVSRFLTEQETSKWPYLTQIAIGQDAIVFLVNAQNPITNLNAAEVRGMYTGALLNWQDIAQPPDNHYKALDDDIMLLSKAKRHGTHSAFIDYFGLNSSLANGQQNKLTFKKEGINNLYAKKHTYIFNKIHQAFGSVSRQTNAIAFESLGAFTIFSRSQNTAFIKILSLNQRAPMIGRRINPNYEFKRPLNIIINQHPSKQTTQFIEYMLSTKGQKMLTDNGYFPLD